MKRLLILFLLLASAPASAEIVKWVDSQGKVHYGDQPPASAKNPQPMNIKNQPGTPEGTAAQKSVAEQEQEFRKRRMETDDAEKKAAEEKTQADAAKQNCVAARSNLKMLQDGVRLTRYNEQGERVFLDDAERTQAMADAQRAVSEWCK